MKQKKIKKTGMIKNKQKIYFSLMKLYRMGN